MNTLLLEKLDRLKNDLRQGQQELEALDRQRLELRDTLLRISGAIHILEEVRADQKSAELSHNLQEVRSRA
jgi:prefoldin subunit 5